MVKRILLINPLVREWSKPNCLPLGLLCIASACRKSGWEVRVLDLNAERRSDDELLNDIQDFEPSIVGITAIITQYDEVKKISYMASLVTSVKYIVCGGPIASSVPDLLFIKTVVVLAPYYGRLFVFRI